MVQGSNPGEGKIFRICPDRPWGPPSLLYNGYWVFPKGKEQPGRDADPSPPSSGGQERVQLYLYFPYDDLYRASVPVQGCTLPYFTFNISTWKWMYALHLVCPNPRCQVSMEAANSCRSSVCNLLHVTLGALTILRQLIDVGKICACMPYIINQLQH
jgi:hypothetical protein